MKSKVSQLGAFFMCMGIIAMLIIVWMGGEYKDSRVDFCLLILGICLYVFDELIRNNKL